MLNFTDLALLRDSCLASVLASQSSFLSDLLTSSPTHSGESGTSDLETWFETERCILLTRGKIFQI